MPEEREIIINVDVEDKDFDKEIGNVNTKLKENNKNIKELSKNYKGNSKEIAKLQASNRELAKSKQTLIKESKTEAGSLDALRLKLAKQTKERNGLNKSSGEGAEKFKELQGSIAGLNEEISGFEEAGGDFRRNVGNYPDLLGSADAATGGFISSLKGMINPLTAAAAAVGGLVAAYLKTGRGTADLARAQDRLAIAFNDVGNAIADFVTDPKGGGIIDGFLRGLQRQFAGISSTIRSDVIVSIKEMIREFELAQLDSDRLAKTFLDQAEKQRQIRDEERNTLQERREANELLLDIINEREEGQIKTQELLISNAKVLLFLDEGNLELQARLKQAEFELADIREEATGFRSEQIINELALARESSQLRTDLLKAELEEQLILSKEGSEESFDIRRQIIEESLAIELEAVGNNLLLRQILEQQAANQLLLLDKEAANTKKGLRDIELAETEIKFKKEEKLLIAHLKEQSDKEDEADRLRGESSKRLAKLQESILDDGKTALIDALKRSSKVGKAVALTQAGINVGEAITKALAGSPPPFNFIAAATVAAAGLIQIRKIASAKTIGGGGGGVPSSPSSNFHEDRQARNDRLAAANTPERRAQALAGSLLGIDAQVQNETNSAIRSTGQGSIQVAVVDINSAQDARNVKVNEASLSG